MAEAQTAEMALALLYQQFSSDLAQAQSLDDGAACCTALIDSTFSPRSASIVWDTGHGMQTLRSYGSVQRHPSEPELAQLQRGDIIYRTSGERVVECFAPLRARGALRGWLFMAHPCWSIESHSLLATIAAQSGPALAMLDIAERQDERVAQLQTLNESGRLLSGVLELDTLLEAIYTAISRLVDYPSFYIALYDEPSDTLSLEYLILNRQRVQREERWAGSAGLTGHVIRTRQPLRADDYAAECRRLGIAPRPVTGLPPNGAWLGVPLIASDRVIGVMVLTSEREDHTSQPEHIDLLKTIAAQAAVAVENARLYQRSERQARQLATLNRIGRTITSSLDPEHVPALIIEQVSELFNVEEVSLLLIDHETGDLVFSYTTGPVGSRLVGRRLPRGTGLAGYVATHGQSVIVNDVQQDNRFDGSTDQTTGFTTRALLAVPLRGVGGTQGVVEVLNRRDGQGFTDEDQRLLEAVADQAVIALENARSFAQIDEALARRAQELVQTNDRLQHSLRSLTALNALGMAINTNLRSANEIFGMTARGVVEMTSALGASVVLADHERLRTAVQIGPTLPLEVLETPLLRTVIASSRMELQTERLPQALARLGARALLVVPLRATQRTLGCMCVYYDQAVPDAPDQETVVLFATQAAVAVESIELFTAVRGGRDQMASILASTREGIMLITPDAQVAIANAALHHLCGLPSRLAQSASVEQFLAAWGGASSYAPEEWAAFCQGLDSVIAGRESFVDGELNAISGQARSVEWAALTALGSGASNGRALLVLRDITEAKESERLRQDLTHMIVHDLRSPLSSVMASIDLLIRGITGGLNDSQRNVLGIAYDSAVQMLEMINTLLDISRLEAGRMPLELKVWPVQPLVERAAERLVPLARDRDVEITIDLPDALAPIQADDELIVRVVQNLISNALKFSGRGSTIHLRVLGGPPPGADADSRGLITVAVQDQGIGIAPQDQEKIFAKFGQVGERRGGTGLGLTFCRLVVEAHGGRIWVESTPGEGSTFLFTLPTV